MHMLGHPAPQRLDAAIARGSASVACGGMSTADTGASIALTGASIALSGASIAPLRKPARVAIAGATGYAGQELLRLLARHPAVAIVAAMSSGATASGRRLPALARVWNGDIQPLSADTLARD